MQPLCPELALKKDFRGTTVLQLRGHKGDCCWGVKLKKCQGLRCRADADRQKYNKRGRDADRGH